MLAGWAREESSPQGPHSSVPATDSRLEKGPRPRNYLSWKSPSGLLLPFPQLSHNPGDGPPPLFLFRLGWKAASLCYEPARHSPPWTWDYSRPWGRRRQGSGPRWKPTLSQPWGGSTPSLPVAKFRCNGRPRPLSSSFLEAWCPKSKGGKRIISLTFLTWVLGSLKGSELLEGGHEDHSPAFRTGSVHGAQIGKSDTL